MNPLPLISCICITYNRPRLLKKAIGYFAAQDYCNKELVISYRIDDLESRKVVDQVCMLSNINILPVERSNEESLGNARNTAIRKCNGVYLCMWDDDDWYHFNRLSFQFNSLNTLRPQYQASILSRILLYDASTQKAYYSFGYTWDGTIMCRKEILLQNQYSDSNFGEDTHVITFLSGREFLYQIENAPFLYIYVYHGYNTWNYQHFKSFIDKSEELDHNSSQTIRQLIAND